LYISKSEGLLKRLLLLVVNLLFLCSGISNSQDSLFTKPIKTKEFELTTEYSKTYRYKSGLKENQFYERYITDCNKIIPISDSVYRVNHKYGSDTLMYKDIKEIVFYGDRKLGKGLMYAALSGAAAGVLFGAYALIWSYNYAKGEDAIGGPITAIYSVPIFTILGTITGGIIGIFSIEHENFDFSKIPYNNIKEHIYKILLQHQINF